MKKKIKKTQIKRIKGFFFFVQSNLKYFYNFLDNIFFLNFFREFKKKKCLHINFWLLGLPAQH